MQQVVVSENTEEVDEKSEGGRRSAASQQCSETFKRRERVPQAVATVPLPATAVASWLLAVGCLSKQTVNPLKRCATHD